MAIKVGDKIQIAFKLEAGEPIRAIQFELHYDHEKIGLTDVSDLPGAQVEVSNEGTAFNSDNSYPPRVVADESGVLKCGVVLLQNAESLPAMPQIAFRIWLKAKAAGETAFILNNFVAFDSENNPIENVAVEGATVMINELQITKLFVIIEN